MQSDETRQLDEDENRNGQAGIAGADTLRQCENRTELLAGRYEILGTIKSGAMGSVYRARDMRLDNTVAVKKMSFVSSNPDEARYAEERFMEEGRLLSELHHEGLPKVIDYFREQDSDAGHYSHYIVMTCIDGDDLESIMIRREKKPFPAQEALGYLRQILDILAYLHSQIPPIIYRDLKPSNIMIDHGKAYLVDFGIARIFLPRQKGTAVGTPGYAAPEQYKGFAEPRSDLYSLGVVMHYICTGRDPEDGSRSPFSFEEPKALNPDIPQSLSNTVMSLVQIIPDRRPRSAEEMLKALSQSKRKSGSAGKPVVKAAITAIILPAALCIIVALMSLHYPEPPGRSKASVSYSKSGGRTPDAVDRYTPAQAKKALKEMNITCSEESLIDRVKNSDLMAAKLLLRSGITPDAADSENGMTALEWAATKVNRDMVRALLEHGADPRKASNSRQTPLHFAAYRGDMEIVKLLISKGAPVNATDLRIETPLNDAASEGKTEVAEYLVSQGADVEGENPGSYSPLFQAVNGSHVDIVRMLIAHGADVSRRDGTGSTPLFLARKREVAEILVSKGADIKARCGTLATPLHAASEEGYVEVIDYLIKKGADIKARDVKGRTPLHYARSKDSVNLLILKGADISARTEEGDTPLHTAASRDAESAVIELLEKGSDINARNDKGLTPLTLALSSGYNNAAKALMKRGAK